MRCFYSNEIKKYAYDFNEKVKEIIENGDNSKILDLTKDENFYKNHPTAEHFLPLYIAFGSALNKKGKSINSEFQYSNISMESFAFDFEG